MSLSLLFLALLLARLGIRHFTSDKAPAGAARQTGGGGGSEGEVGAGPGPGRAVRWGALGDRSPEALVAAQVERYAQIRRGYAQKLAERAGLSLDPDVERFFGAVEVGQWEDIERWFQLLVARRQGSPRPPELDAVWPAVLDAYGAAEQAHHWPAKQLLEYGESVLGALKPGMVYLGGTDAGRWVPSLLAENGQGTGPIVITQNLLADAAYLDYVALQYGDRLKPLTAVDAQRAFAEYAEEARKRAQHDADFPHEPKQLRSGEDVTVGADGQTRISGQVSVMGINERLVQRLLEQNPELTFGLQESFPLRGTYAEAAPLGPIMELRSGSGKEALSPEQVALTTGHWEQTVDRLMQEPEAVSSTTAREAFAHDANSQANLLAAREQSAAAEQLYRQALRLWPDNAESMHGLIEVVAGAGRREEAVRLLDGFLGKRPELVEGWADLRARIRTP
jgi:tetratricopeptide (TPR) repeat protein